ncbi:MAG TPA: hypothetical protein VFM38_02330 [Candidatus Limnocylindrales bacterium]|nr:hypothetical protein [Candidatus Limnocylindrales bacterium]
MHRSRLGAAGTLFVSCLLIAGCTAAPAASTASQAVLEPSSAATPTLPVTGPSPTPSAAPTEPPPRVEPSASVDPAVPQLPVFDAATFSNGATITNEWLPLQPGRRWIEDGVTIEDGERIPHRIVFTVTNLTKKIMGVDTVVAYVEDITDGELVEKEIAFYAQDDAGTVWYFGEHPEEYEDGEFVAAPTWIAGLAEAKPGVKMYADPSSHPGALYQGYAPAVDWNDYGRLDEHLDKDCVDAGCFNDVYRFAESSDGEPGIFQLKSYAKGIGEIRVGWRGGGDSQEDLNLKSKATLKGAGLEKFDALARAMEAHAYKISPDLYGKTEKMQ